MPSDRAGAHAGPVKMWLETLGSLASSPRSAASRVGVDGPLDAPLRFAAVALALHGLGLLAVTGGVWWWSMAASLERFGARDSVGRIVMTSEMIPMLVTVVLAVPCVAAVAPFALALAARIGGGTVTLRASVRACSYACGYLMLAGVPLVGLLAYPLALYFVACWLEATTNMSRASRTAAMGIHVALSWATLRASTIALDALLRTHVEDLLMSLLG